MGLSVTTNVVAMNARRHLAMTSDAMSRSLERLSSGLRVNRAADDAAGLAISEGLRSQVRGMSQAVRNTQDAISVVQTADGALSATTSILQRMRDLTVQAANTGALDRGASTSIQLEIRQLRSELTRIADTTTSNGTKLLDGTYDGTFQVGANAGETIDVTIDRALGAAGLGLDGVDVTRLLDPAVATYGAQGERDAPRAGAVVFRAGTLPGGRIAGLTGTIAFDNGSPVDLAAATGPDDAAALAQLNAAASGAGITHRPDPFVLDSDGDLVFWGPVPASGTPAAALTPITPRFVAASGASSSPTVFAPQGLRPASAGLIDFPGTAPTDIPALRGSISANGITFDLGSVDYTDTDGDRVIDGAEALAQLNAAARTAGITTSSNAFVVAPLIILGNDDEFDDRGDTLHFTGAVPAPTATPAELAEVSPTFTPAEDPITAVDRALASVSDQRAYLGALQNRFQHTLDGLGFSIENTAAAESRIRDTDMATEMARFTRSQVLVQAGTSMLAQANQVPQNVLKLLG